MSNIFNDTSIVIIIIIVSSSIHHRHHCWFLIGLTLLPFRWSEPSHLQGPGGKKDYFSIVLATIQSKLLFNNTHNSSPRSWQQERSDQNFFSRILLIQNMMMTRLHIWITKVKNFHCTFLLTSSSYIIFIKISKLPNSSFITITLPLTSPYFLSLSSDKSPTSWKNELQRSDRVKNNQK